jgi:LmbE family N-acetylglucosaminyl deacetylase
MNVLVISAHPDDAEFAMGGTLIQLAREHSVTLFVLTDGSAGRHGTPAQRRVEQESVANKLGIRLEWGGIPDCHVQYTRERAFWLAGIMRNAQADIVFVPHWDQDGGLLEGRAHPDHRNAGLLARDAARFARFKITAIPGIPHEPKMVLYYMAPPHRTPKLTVPVDSVAEEMRALWDMHATQANIRNNLHERLLAMRREYAHPGNTYAEAFDTDGPLPLGIDALRYLH